jgi:iron complex outermembrane recepter protein
MMATAFQIRTLPGMLLALSCAPAFAQGSGDNALTSAEDAFGTSVGRETIGIYNSARVRGFSPTVAGNVRVDGLYFDQVWGLTTRLQRATTIRVGLSAQSYPFPAPTGIVDYTLRIPGKDSGLRALVASDEWGSAAIEFDGVLPMISDRLTIGVGGAASKREYYNGTDAYYFNGAVIARWQPTQSLQIVPYWQRVHGEDDESGPIYVPSGDFLPPRVERRQFNGPDWAQYRGGSANYGALVRYEPDENWLVRTGVFRSEIDDERLFANLLVRLEQDGSAEQLIFADPPSKVVSTSGELRVTRSITDGSRLHVIHLSTRARERTRTYGGSSVLNLGPTLLGTRANVPEPGFVFGAQTYDRIEQTTLGAAYVGRWQGIGEIGAGLQWTDYFKSFEQPDAPLTETTSRPWLYYMTLAITPSEKIAFYAGFTRGLEETGVAPDNADNRKEALPAIITRQVDGGVRYALTSKLKLVAGVFDVRKPYLSIDETGLFRELGEVRHRGVEMSIAGALTPQLSIVAGAVLQEPEVGGEAVALGRVGSRPIDQPDSTLQINLEWRPRANSTFSFDAGATYTSELAATTSNRVELPPLTIVDVGGRYNFKIGKAPATLRVSVTNLLDEFGYDLRGSGAYDVIPGRLAAAYVVADW